MANSTVKIDNETKNLLRQISSKMEGMTGLADSLKEGLQSMKDMKDMLVDGNGAFFTNISNSLLGTVSRIKADEQVGESAMADNRLAMHLGGGSPERGTAEYYQQIYASTPASPAETQAAALKETFNDSGVLDSFKKMLSGASSAGQGSDVRGLNEIIQEATKGQADDRSLGEKVADKFLVGRVFNKAKNWFSDRDIRKEEKATAKDQGVIKREQKAMDRLNAKYRKMKNKGASDEELDALREGYNQHKEKQTGAATRINERRNTDLTEMDIPKERTQTAQEKYDEWMKDLLSIDFGSVDLLKKPDAAASSLNPKMAIGMDAAKTPEVITPSSGLSSSGKTFDKSKAIDAEVVKDAGDEALDIRRKLLTQDSPVIDNKNKADSDKENGDIQRKLDTQLRPEFYKEGTALFKKGNSGELFGSLNDSLAGLKKGLGGVGKGGLYAALGVASIASIAKIGEAASLVKDWWKSSGDAKKTRDAIHDQGAAAHQNMKKGWNDELRDAYSELEMAEKALDNTWLFDGKEKKRLEEAKRKVEREKKKMEEFQKAREAAGIDFNDNKAMTEFKKKWDAEQKAKMKAALAAGNAKQVGTPNATTPGASTQPEKVETAAEQAKRIEDATFTGTKKALLDSDVQKQNEANAKTTGQQIDQSLVGRK